MARILPSWLKGKFVFLIVASLLSNTAFTAFGPKPEPAVAATEPAAANTPIPFDISGRKALYVFGTGGDNSTQTEIVAFLVDILQGRLLKDSALPIGVLNWSVNDYVNQCTRDPNGTEGALIITSTPATSSTKSELLNIRQVTWTEVFASARFANCVANDPRSPKFAYTWSSPQREANNWHNTYTPLPAVGFLVVIAAGVLAFVPSKTAISATTRVFPTSGPIPATGRVSQVTTTSQSQSNVNQFGTVSAALLANSLNYSSNTQIVQPGAVEQTYDTEWKVANYLMDETNCKIIPTASPTPSATPSPPLKDLSIRTVPEALPTARAPFCAD